MERCLAGLRLRGRRLKVNIIFVGVIIFLANKSITTNGFTSWSVSVNDYRKPLLNHVGSLSLSNITTRAIEMTGFTIHQKKRIFSPLQPTSATNIVGNRYYLGPLEKIL